MAGKRNAVSALVLGGGITGLSIAHRLLERGCGKIDVTILEVRPSDSSIADSPKHFLGSAALHYECVFAARDVGNQNLTKIRAGTGLASSRGMDSQRVPRQRRD